jgi:hypothetical protein
MPYTNIFELRQWLGFKRAEFALKVGVSTRTLKIWEDGKRKPRSQRIISEFERVKELLVENGLVTMPLPGLEWFEAHKNDYSQQDIDNLALVINSGHRVTTLKSGAKTKDLRVVLADVVK